MSNGTSPESLPFDEILRELGRRLRAGDYLNLDEYFDLIRCATLHTLAPKGGDSSKRGVGVQLGGVTFCLAFTARDLAAAAARHLQTSDIVEVDGQAVLRRVPDGAGIIIDWRSDSEIRITPHSLIELVEKFGVKSVREEATDEWLTELNDKFTRDSSPQDQRAALAMTEWAGRNGFSVVPGSRRARRISAFFECHDPDPEKGRRRYEVRWRREYHTDRYLASLTDSQLLDRFSTIARNRDFSDRLVLPHELTDREWAELGEHVGAEAESRGLPESFFDRPANPLPRLATARDALGRDAGREGQLFRFSKREFLAPLLSDGIMRLFPATTYSEDPSLRPAQRDDELARTVLLDPKTVRIERRASDGRRFLLSAPSAIALSSVSRTNYYVWCATTVIDPRFFDDFDSDACLIIHDVEAFNDRLYRATKIALPGWVGAERLVEYFDPVRDLNRVLDVYHKDFRFAYQREYRYIWDPLTPQIAKRLPPVELRLGSLADIARLVAL